MANIYGVLGLNANDSQLTYVQTIGQRAIYDAVSELFTMWNDDLAAMKPWLVEGPTEEHKWRYLLPGGGRLQKVGPQSQPKAVKAAGNWDVAFPLEEWAAEWAAGRVAYAYMTMADLNRHLSTIYLQDVNTQRFEMMRAVLNNTARTFVDPVRGSLTIQPLAIASDGVVYPPVLGSETEQTLDRYAGTNYAASAISDVNDPIVTAVGMLESSFGTPTGGSRIVVFINNAQTAKVEALTAFTPVTSIHIQPGTNTATVLNLPDGLPGRVLGVHDTTGAVIVEWRWWPANYLLAVHYGVAAPLMERHDPGYTGLPRGLTLVATSDRYPFSESIYSHRFGFGVGNRPNGVVLQFVASTTYTIPTGFT